MSAAVAVLAGLAIGAAILAVDAVMVLAVLYAPDLLAAVRERIAR